MPAKEDLIRERARAIWEREGRPEGHHERHWHEARAELEAEEASADTSDHPSQRPEPDAADIPDPDLRATVPA